MNSSLSGEDSAMQSGWIVTSIDQTLGFIGIHANETFLSLMVRKLAHFTEFFILTLLWIKALKDKKIAIIYAIGISSLVALLDESLQLFIPGRNGNIIDVFIDISGSLLAYFIYIRLINRKEYSKSS